MLTKTNNSFDAVIETPVCRFGLQFDNGFLSSTEYLKKDYELYLPEAETVQVLIRQISDYFLDPANAFNIEIRPKGTDFQQRVWRQMQKIPAGQVKTYGEVAKILNSSPRAVGNACRANPMPLIIPCHRIVSSSGLGGFAGTRSGYFTEIKRQLLRHEGLEI